MGKILPCDTIGGKSGWRFPMNEKRKRLEVQDNIVVSMDYSLTVEGQVIDSSEGSEPLQFVQGTGQILPALEERLYGMCVGDSKQVTLSALESYGESDPEAFADIPRKEFPKEIPLNPGIELELKDPQGEKHYAVVHSADERNVRLNFNHPLAGKELVFSIRIVALRHATAEEQEHGHVHSASIHE